MPLWRTGYFDGSGIHNQSEAALCAGYAATLEHEMHAKESLVGKMPIDDEIDAIKGQHPEPPASQARSTTSASTSRTSPW
jgi:hypothetical protein